MAFKDILGNQRIKKILKRSLKKDKVPNSLLFCGPEGSGKKDTALVLAKAMNCQNKRDDACEICSSCKAINSESFPDVILLALDDVEKNRIKLIRELRQLAYLKPMVAKKKIFIIEDAEKMRSDSANTLLKVLEEPPLSTHIILLTNNFYAILPTIKSRCQTMMFSQVSFDEVAEHLMDSGIDRDKAKIISFLVRGNLREALALDWEELRAQREEAWDLLLSFLESGKTSVFFEKFYTPRENLQKDIKRELMRDFAKRFKIISSFCRDLILIKEKCDESLLMNPDYKDELMNVEGFFDLDWLMEFIKKIENVHYGIQRNLNFNLVVSSTFSDFMEWSHV
jgi:DNA polymerase III delta' subunit